MWPKQSHSGPESIPRLRRQGSAIQRVVDEEPYLIIGGELHNSSSSSLNYMKPIWARLKALHLNTVLAVVAWEMVEVEEGIFDFSLIDGLIHATYVDAVAAAGKAEYPLPLFANAWLSSLGSEPGGWASGGQKPGEWPSGGPLPQTLDVWMAGAPNIDFLAPDIYQPEFEAWCQQYVRRDNPLFIPEMRGNDDGARQVFYALGEHDAMGVSPFGIDSIDPEADKPIERSYAVLRQLIPAILEHQGQSKMIGFLLSEEEQVITRQLGGYQLEISLDEGFGQSAERGAGLIIATDDNEFLGGGFGFRVRFKCAGPNPSMVGLIAVNEGRFEKGDWIPGRRLNGDETGRGNYWRFYDYQPKDGRAFTNDVATGISTCTVYRYE